MLGAKESLCLDVAVSAKMKSCLGQKKARAWMWLCGGCVCQDEVMLGAKESMCLDVAVSAKMRSCWMPKKACAEMWLCLPS